MWVSLLQLSQIPEQGLAQGAKGRTKGKNFLSAWGAFSPPTEIPTCSKSLSQCQRRGGDATGLWVSPAVGAAAATWLLPQQLLQAPGGGFRPEQEEFGPHPSSSWARLVPLLPSQALDPKLCPYRAQTSSSSGALLTQSSSLKQLMELYPSTSRAQDPCTQIW